MSDRSMYPAATLSETDNDGMNDNNSNHIRRMGSKDLRAPVMEPIETCGVAFGGIFQRENKHESL
ncbi:MAG: hypothetical protein ABII79_04005 [bacterium]